MINKKKHPKIFYVPGMISLVLLSLFCFWFFYENDFLKEYHAINISFPNKEYVEKLKEEGIFTTFRKYKVFSFDKAEKFELKKLENMQLACRKLKKERDTINGVKIHFGKHSDYATYIRILDIMAEEDMPTYINYINDWYVFIGTSKKQEKDTAEKYDRMNCGTPEMQYRKWLGEERIIKLEEKKQEQITYNKKIIWIPIAYFGIVILNIFALVKFNNNRK